MLDRLIVWVPIWGYIKTSVEADKAYERFKKYPSQENRLTAIQKLRLAQKGILIFFAECSTFMLAMFIWSLFK